MSQRGTLSEVDYLKTCGLTVPPESVRRAVRMLEAGTSLHAVYKDGDEENCVAKGTARKIKRLLQEGKLEDFKPNAQPSMEDGLPEKQSVQGSGGSTQPIMEKEEPHAKEEVSARGNPNEGQRGTNVDAFRGGLADFAEIQQACSAELNRRLRASLGIEPHTPPQQPPDSLVLNVVSHNLAPSKDQFGDFHLGLCANLEVAAQLCVEVVECVLIMGGRPVSQCRYLPNRGKLLGEATWYPSFPIPPWVQPGTYGVRIGALLAKTSPPFSSFFTRASERLAQRLEEGRDEYVMSNEFEVTIPESLAAAVAAKKAAEMARKKALEGAEALDTDTGRGR